MIDDNILVFAHMMKTAGSNLNRKLIGIYGPRLHMVPGGLKIDDNWYDVHNLKSDYKKLNGRLSILTGHPMRPYIDFGEFNQKMKWFTFFRDPEKRYLSHYFHDRKWTNDFAYKRYRSMKTKSIEEWEGIQNYRNYQTKFIAGEENLDKAIEILENKFSWVGLTEEFNESLRSLSHHFDLAGLNLASSTTNSNLANSTERESVKDQFADFIAQQNQLDSRLYNYVASQIWPRYRLDESTKISNKSISKLKEEFNIIRWQIVRQTKFRTVDFNWDNIKRFYRRWYRN